jgi:protein TonB
VRAAEKVIIPNRNRQPIAFNCVLLYQVLKLQDEQVPSSAAGNKGGSSSTAVSSRSGSAATIPSAEHQAGWRVVNYPDGGQLRYLPPLNPEPFYPQSAKDAGLQGESRLALEVLANGRISKCEVIQSSGSPELDEAACFLYRSKAKFQIVGIPVPLRLTAPVTWRLESDKQAPPEPVRR